MTASPPQVGVVLCWVQVYWLCVRRYGVDFYLLTRWGDTSSTTNHKHWMSELTTLGLT